MLVEGILALQAGENPRMVRDKLMAYVPPSSRAEDVAQVEAAGAEA
jgi:chemotaxis protein MotA